MNKVLLSFAIMAGVFCHHAYGQEQENIVTKTPSSLDKTENNQTISQDMPDEYFGYYIYKANTFTFNKRLLDKASSSNEYLEGAHFLTSILKDIDKEAANTAAEEMLKNGGFVIKRDKETFLFVVSALDTTARKKLNIKPNKDIKKACVDHPWATH